jgi:hypothetical protein
MSSLDLGGEVWGVSSSTIDFYEKHGFAKRNLQFEMEL